MSRLRVLSRIPPMLAGSGRVPDADDRYACEVKYDGWRAQLYVDGASWRVLTFMLRHAVLCALAMD